MRSPHFLNAAIYFGGDREFRVRAYSRAAYNGEPVVVTVTPKVILFALGCMRAKTPMHFMRLDKLQIDFRLQ